MMTGPSQRARADEDEPDQTSCDLPSSSTRIKDERSPSPRGVVKRLVTSGTKRFTPVPSDCLPSCTGYKQNRLKWAESCVKELEALNLISERKLFRDDGLIIDWRSHVPIWSDTLKPDPKDLAAIITLTHRSNAQWHRPPVRKESPLRSVTTISTREFPTSTSSASGNLESPSKERLPAPPRPSLKRRNNSSRSSSFDVQSTGSPSPKKPRHSTESERKTHAPSRDCIPSVLEGIPLLSDSSLRSQAASGTCDQLVAPDPSPDAEEGMSKMTLDYVRRYIQTYELDRAGLASAYASNASFAYRVHHIVRNINTGSSSVWAASPNCSFSGSKRTRLDIATTLVTLPSLHVGSQNSGVAQIEYDMFYLGVKLGMFVVCRVMSSTKTVVHNFILRRKEVDAEDAAIEGV